MNLIKRIWNLRKLTFAQFKERLKVKLFIKYCNLRGKQYPVRTSLFMSELCNFKCTGCRRTVLNYDKKGYLELKDVKLLLKKYPTIRLFTIAGQGEPSLSPNFEEIINYLTSIDKAVKVITNGTKPGKFDGIKDKDKIEISISLYGLDNEKYQEYTKTSLYEQVIETFKTLKKDFTNVGFSYIVSKENYQDLEKLLPLMDELKPKFLHLHGYLVYDDKSYSEIAKTITDMDKDIINYVMQQIGSRNYVSQPYFMETNDDGYYCSSYTTNQIINLNPAGEINGCARQVVPSAEVGNIYTEKDPFNNKAMNNFRKKACNGDFPHDECKYCFGRFDDKKNRVK